MIKVLVVDDDKLVRKGLISVMPWKEFNMQVVGEARDGEKALEFLEAEEVDLLITDLAMPVMSGIELMRIVRQRFPHLFIVVLTLHQDFEYIQEALRLGAIDYIIKVQLEKERFEEILDRIHNRIMKEQGKDMPHTVTAGALDMISSDEGYALISTIEQPKLDSINEIINFSEQDWHEVAPNLLFWLPIDNQDGQQMFTILSKFVTGNKDWVGLRLHELGGERKSHVYRLLREYKETFFFYEYDAGTNILHKPIRDFDSKPSVLDDKDFKAIKEQWSSLNWVHQSSLFEHLLTELRTMRLPISKLTLLLHLIVNEWNSIYYLVTSRRIELPDSFRCWHEVENWLCSTRVIVTNAIGKPQYSPEVQDCILKAVHLVHREMSEQLYAADVAKRVNLSRGYFSQCFKDIVGRSFNEYVRDVRIEKAKEYLLHTNKTILWIAGSTGYLDEKYFSRIFREQTGMLPSEYRKENIRPK